MTSGLTAATDAGPSLRARWLRMIDALPDGARRLVNPVRDAHGRLTGGHTLVAVDDRFALRRSERLVAAALADLLGCDGHGSPRVDRIAAASGCAPERVSAALRRFEAAGLLEREHCHGRHRCDVFTLRVPGDPYRS